MSQLLFFPNVRTRDFRPQDDLEPARGVLIAWIIGLSFWITIFILGQWIFD